MKINTGVQVILWCCHRNVKGCKVGITDDIYEAHRSDGLRCYDIPTKFHEDWIGHSGNIKVITLTI
jgi:hypothetical protein